MIVIFDKLDSYELVELRDKYNKTIKEIDKELEKRPPKVIDSNYKIEADNNNHYYNRLQHYLEITNISDIKFLHRSLEFTKGNNKGPLNRSELVLLNKKAYEIAKSYGVVSPAKLSNIILYNKNHPLLKDRTFIQLYQKSQTLSHLDEVFKEEDNCIDYQNSYTTFKYIKNYLESVLSGVGNSPKQDNELVFKDYQRKISIVTENIVPIANELLKLRNSVTGLRLSVCNQSLYRMANKKPTTKITYIQQVFIQAIAYGTTLEKLESKDYSDAKQLVYLPYKK